MTDYHVQRMKIIREQRDWSKVPQLVITCANCKRKVAQGQEGATQVHHWLFPGRKGYPPEILHSEYNLVWVCRDCHIPEHPDLKLNSYKLKKSLGYDIEDWLQSLLSQGLIKELPELPQEKH